MCICTVMSLLTCWTLWAELSLKLSGMIFDFICWVGKGAIFFSLAMITCRTKSCNVSKLTVVLSQRVSSQFLIILWMCFKTLVSKRTCLKIFGFFANFRKYIQNNRPILVFLHHQGLHEFVWILTSVIILRLSLVLLWTILWMPYISTRPLLISWYKWLILLLMLITQWIHIH